MVSKKFVFLGCLVTSVLMGSNYQGPYSGGIGDNALQYNLPKDYEVAVGQNALAMPNVYLENTTMGADTLDFDDEMPSTTSTTPDQDM